MPYFSTQPSSSGGLMASLKRAIGGGGEELDPMQRIKIDQAAATTAQHMAVADKVRAEVENQRRDRAQREDPNAQAQFASDASGVDTRTGRRIFGNLRGEVEQPGQADIDDAAVVGGEARAFPMGPANVPQRTLGRFQDALAALGAERFGEGKSNAEQLLQAAGRNAENRVFATAEEAARNRDVTGVNLNAAGVLGRKELTPFKTDAHGITTNEYVGTRDEAGPTAQGNIGRIAAQALKENAAARAQDAHAGLFRAQTGKTNADREREEKGTYDSTRGILVDSRAGTAREVLGADGKPIGAHKKSDFKDVTTLRKEFNDQAEVKAYRDVLPIVESARSAPDTRAGDIQMAYAVGKILDPNSVVREGELKLVGDAATIPEKLQGQIRTLVMGSGRMTPETRAQLVSMLDNAVANRTATYKATEATYRTIAQQNGFPLDQVIIDPPKGGAGGKPKIEARKNVGGVEYVKINGQWMQP